MTVFSQIHAEELILSDKKEKIESVPKTIYLPNSVQLGGFIDSYYLYNRNLPKDTERNYTTQAVRNNEFNINLAYLEAKVEEKNIAEESHSSGEHP